MSLRENDTKIRLKFNIYFGTWPLLPLSVDISGNWSWQLVLHAYSDEDCVKILKKSREAISGKGKEGKVIIIDIVINDKEDKHELTDPKLYFDLLMMVAVTGREREEREWKKLFLEAGFSHYKITPFFGLRSLLEVYP